MLPAPRLNRLLTATRWLVLVAALLFYVPTQACNVPVFRYALENWPPETFEIVVFRSAPLAGPDASFLEQVRAVGTQGDSRTNTQVWDVDVKATGEIPEWISALWEKEKTRSIGRLPWLVVAEPLDGGPEHRAWSGPFERATVRRILDSPTRQAAVNALLTGSPWVWIVIDGQDPKANAAARAAIKEAMAATAQSVVFPSKEEMLADPARPDRPMIPLPLEVRTTVLTVAEADPAERQFIAQLRAPEFDRLRNEAGPEVYFMFGQGRVLGPYAGDQLAKEPLTEICEFLAGACSCQVKNENPGFDVIVAARWREAFEEKPDFSEMGLPWQEPAAAAVKNEPAPAAESGTGVNRTWLAIGALVLVGGGAWFLFRTRRVAG